MQPRNGECVENILQRETRLILQFATIVTEHTIEFFAESHVRTCVRIETSNADMKCLLLLLRIAAMTGDTLNGHSIRKQTVDSICSLCCIRLDECPLHENEDLPIS